MDKQTLSNYGWLVIVTLILAVMLALATPFGTYVGDAVVSVANGFVGSSNNAMDNDNIDNMSNKWSEKLNGCSHSNTIIVDEVDSTCTETGYSGNVKCADCGIIVSNGTIIPALGHVKTNGVCNNCGIEITDWITKTWNGLTQFDASGVWTDGENIYYSYNSKQYILNGDTWEPKTWNGLTSFHGGAVWTDGTNYYHSSGSNQYVLNGDTWEPKTWINPPMDNYLGTIYISASNIWTDGTNYYYSSGSTHQYILNGDTWSKKTWNGLTSFSACDVWTDGANIYCSNGNSQYVLNGDTWEKKTWNENGHTYILGSHIWTDGTNIYYSCNSYQYVLNGDTWEPKTWTGLPDFNLSNFQASNVWTDGTNYYYSRDMVHRVLVK